MKRLLSAIFLSSFLLAFIPSCKHPKTESKLLVTVTDTNSVPVLEASVILDIPRDTGKSNPLKEQFPLVLLTDQNGRVTKDFDNGIVLKVVASKGNMTSKNITIVLDAGETEERSLSLDRKKP
jgi:hypothetical protein